MLVNVKSDSDQGHIYEKVKNGKRDKCRISQKTNYCFLSVAVWLLILIIVGNNKIK